MQQVLHTQCEVSPAFLKALYPRIAYRLTLGKTIKDTNKNSPMSQINDILW